MEKRKGKNKKILWVILALFAVFILIGAIANTDVENETTKSGEQQSVSSNISEHDAEVFCQDAALLGKYLDMDRVDVIDVLNYDVHYTEIDSTKEGKPIMQLNWNGKQDGERAGFACLVSGTADNITLEELRFNGTTLYDV